MEHNKEHADGTVLNEDGGGAWSRVAAVSALKEDAPLAIDLDGKSVGVFLANGRIYAVDNVCPHAYALLSQGFVEGQTVECPLHGAIFELPTGKCLSGPSNRDIETFEVRIDNGDILVRPRTPG